MINKDEKKYLNQEVSEINTNTDRGSESQYILEKETESANDFPIESLNQLKSSDNYNLEEDSSESDFNEKEPTPEGPSGPQIWGVFFRILLSTVEGWKSLKRMNLAPEKLNSTLLYPTIALSAAVNFLTSIYYHSDNIQVALPASLETFCGLFFGYFCVIIIGKLLLSKEGRNALDTTFGKNFVGVSITSLAIFEIFYEGLPMLQPILVFLPLWTIFIISRGCRLLGIPQENRIQTTTILSVLTIGLPIAIKWVLAFFFSARL